MSSDRARTPSPHKQSRVEPGVFSSLSSFQYYKAASEDRKVSSAAKTRAPLPVRSKSPVKVAVTVSPVRTKKPTGPRTPERTSHSPALTRATASDLNQPTLRGGDEISRLQDTIKKLTSQVSKEKKTVSVLEQRLSDEENAHKQEQAKLRNDLVSIQQTVQKWKSQQSDKAQTELAALRSNCETSKMHIKSLVGVFVGVLENLLVKNFYSDELMMDPVEEERLNSLEAIQKLLVSRLEAVAAGTGTDLDTEIAGVKNWTPKPTYQLPKQMPKSTSSKPTPQPESFNYDPEDEEKAFPQISYSVEYFTEDLPVEAEPEALHPLNPLRILDENRAKPVQSEDRTSEVDQLKMRIMSRIKGKSEEIVGRRETEFAVALYDFEGERVGFR